MRFPISVRRLLPFALVAAVAAAAAAPAGAIIENAPGPDFSYQPLNGQGLSSKDVVGANMTFHGGPVMHSHQQIGVFWGPSGSFPAGYEAAIARYFQDVAADSGRATNVYSVATQYTDGTGRASYQASAGGAFEDTNAYPASGCNNYTGSVSYTTCLSNAQLVSELNSFIAAHSLPHGFGVEYFIFLPPNIGQCFQSGAASSCFDRNYCAYHTFTGSASDPTLFASQPYAPINPVGCGTREYPNGNTNGNVDDELSSVSHEANETITDPTLSAWFDTNTSGENGDLCRNTGSFFGDYGNPIGGGPGTFFNQLINNGHYILQQEWSNAANGGAGGCEQRYNLTGAISGPTSATAGRSVTFNGAGADGDGGSVTALSWNFGDGGTASGASVSHTFTSPGTVTVTLGVANTTGLVGTATQQVTVSRPPNGFSFGRVKLNKRKGNAKLPVSVPGPGTLSLRGKGLAPQRERQRAKTVSGAGTFKLLVKPKGKTKKKLRKAGKAKVTAKVTYTPEFGVANTKTKKIKLVRR